MTIYGTDLPPGVVAERYLDGYHQQMRTKQAEYDRMRSRSILMALEQLRRITRQ